MSEPTLPETMRAVVLHDHGGPEVLAVEQVPRPHPGPGQVLVRVRAVALNRLDLWVRGGLPGLRLEYPHRLGSDIAGDVVEVGPGANPRDLGREVLVNPGFGCGSCAHCLDGWDNLCRRYRILGENTQGGYGEYLVVPAENLLPRPRGMSWTDAAAIPLTFLTAWQMLVVRARVAPGDVVLMHAAGSGVGSAGLQIAKLHGAKVVALASTQAKLDKARELGADACICSAEEDWEQQVRALDQVGKRGVDIVFEHVGEATWERSIRLTRKGGTVVTCGASSGWKAKTDLRQVFFRQIQILGSTMGSRTHLHRILKLVEAGKLSPVVDRVFPLEEAADAHRYLDRREQFGKVVLEVSDD
jgi:NADPH:quinone reductase-like Zn-dependent oxidoreductase